MGLDVELIRIEQRGTSPRRRRDTQMAVVADTRDRFAEAIERGQHRGTTPMLDRLDRYGLVELSWDEMPQFLGELDRLLANAVDDREREVLAAVRRLGESCGEDRLLALRFVGD